MGNIKTIKRCAILMVLSCNLTVFITQLHCTCIFLTCCRVKLSAWLLINLAVELHKPNKYILEFSHAWTSVSQRDKSCTIQTENIRQRYFIKKIFLFYNLSFFQYHAISSMENNRIHVNIYVYGTSMIGFLHTRTHFLTLMHTLDLLWYSNIFNIHSLHIKYI